MQSLIEGDRQAFYDREIAAREETGLPPFGRLASLIVSAGEKAAAESHARQLVAAAPYNEGLRILGPAEAPLSLIRGRHRFRLLAKSARMFDLSGYLRDWLSAAPKPRGGVKVAVDVDPQSFL
jgi:primosomal protein N' (replication factor Y)